MKSQNTPNYFLIITCHIYLIIFKIHWGLDFSWCQVSILSILFCRSLQADWIFSGVTKHSQTLENRMISQISRTDKQQCWVSFTCGHFKADWLLMDGAGGHGPL